MNQKFWSGKKVLITGHTGFKGSWLTIWLSKLGANITGISLDPITKPNLFTLAKVNKICNSLICDIRDFTNLKKSIDEFDPEIVFHLAAQPLVRKSYADPRTTFTTNIIGTINLLECIRTLSNLKVGVFITTDKVYKDKNSSEAFTEDDPLGGYDPYSSSKVSCEIIIESYRNSFFNEKKIPLLTARAGNVIGGGDWSEDRLIPDAIRSWKSNNKLYLRNQNAIRPWQHVLDPVAGYLKVAEILWKKPSLAGSYNFGPPKNQKVSVKKIIELARKKYGLGEYEFNKNTDSLYETNILSLNPSKLNLKFGIISKWNLENTVNKTMNWYRKIELDNSQARQLCELDINSYEEKN